MEGSTSDCPLDPVHSVVSLCLCCFSVMDMVYVSCSSKALGQLCQSKLSEGNKQLAHGLLSHSVKEASGGVMSMLARCRLDASIGPRPAGGAARVSRLRGRL